MMEEDEDEKDNMKVAAATTVEIRPDLYARAHDHVSFLRKLHGLGVTLMTTSTNSSSSLSSSSSSSWNARESLRRYTQLWLPLVQESHLASYMEDAPCTRRVLIPPADVAWLWYCHRLAPAKYEEYLHQQFGTASSGAAGDDLENAKSSTTAAGILQLEDPLVPFQFLTPDSPTGASGRTLEFWKLHYPNEPFFYKQEASLAGEQEGEEQPTTAAVSVERRITTKIVTFFNHMTESWTSSSPTTRCISSSSSQLLCGFDLLECATRQATFLWQISGPDFHQPVDRRSNTNSMALNSAFLTQAVQNYQDFFRLSPQARHRDHALVPTIAVELIWRTHILASLQRYKQDCATLLGDGVEFHHEDMIPSQDLKAAFGKTCQLWKMTYQSDFRRYGGLNRGHAPQRFYNGKWQDIGSKPTRTATALRNIIITVRSSEQTNGNQDNGDEDVIGRILLPLFQVLFRLFQVLPAIFLIVFLGYALDLWGTKTYRIIIWVASGIVAMIFVPKSVRDNCCGTTTASSGRRRRDRGSDCGGECGSGCGCGGGRGA